MEAIAGRLDISSYTVFLKLHEAGAKIRARGRGLAIIKLDRVAVTCLSQISDQSPQDAVLDLIAAAYFAKTGELAPFEPTRRTRMKTKAEHGTRRAM